jgi:hypothetical protein
MTGNTPQKVLLNFQNLHTAFIDAHNDFQPNEESISHDRPPSLGRYHLLTAYLPCSLRRLWIVNAHGPDAAILQALCLYCPQLEELSISRCTYFSPRLRYQSDSDCVDPCKYWTLFPGEHDSYFSSEGVYEYAVSLTQKQTADLPY